ncbi:Uncharacterised protein [Klebsiella pneumoniae]|nr:Uncharacterised protein [Klebsiella pneumoniae]
MHAHFIGTPRLWKLDFVTAVVDTSLFRSQRHVRAALTCSNHVIERAIAIGQLELKLDRSTVCVPCFLVNATQRRELHDHSDTISVVVIDGDRNRVCGFQLCVNGLWRFDKIETRHRTLVL